MLALITSLGSATNGRMIISKLARPKRVSLSLHPNFHPLEKQQHPNQERLHLSLHPPRLNQKQIRPSLLHPLPHLLPQQLHRHLQHLQRHLSHQLSHLLSQRQYLARTHLERNARVNTTSKIQILERSGVEARPTISMLALITNSEWGTTALVPICENVPRTRGSRPKQQPDDGGESYT